MAVPIPLMSFGRMRPDLDPLAGQWRPIPGPPPRSGHYKPAISNLIDDRRARAIVIRPPRMVRVGANPAACAGTVQAKRASPLA